MKYLVMLLLSCGLMACSLNKDDNSRIAKGGGGSDNDPQNQKPENKRENKTPYQVCGTGSSTLTLPTGRWEMLETQGESFFKIALEFLPNVVTLRQDCYNKGRRLTAEVIVGADYKNGILKILADANDIDQTEDKTGKFNCKVALKTEESKYRFQGNCLELLGFQGRERLLFVPQ